jgi:predicted lactoylglutathione lyase
VRSSEKEPAKGENMATKIFVNLSVKDLKKSIEFFTKLGFTFNQQFTDETATCMIVTDDIFVMLLTETKFKTFTPKEICDTKNYTEVLVALALENRAKSGRNGSKSSERWRHHLQSTARLWVHV